MEETTDKKEVKRRFQLWVKPSTIKLADKIYKQDNCSSKSEFIEKAIMFYSGYLASGEHKDYIPNIITSTLKSIVAESDNRTSRILFKIAVELSILQNIIAGINDIDTISLSKLRGECIKEVKKINGTLSFEDAVDWQKG